MNVFHNWDSHNTIIPTATFAVNHAAPTLGRRFLFLCDFHPPATFRLSHATLARATFTRLSDPRDFRDFQGHATFRPPRAGSGAGRRATGQNRAPPGPAGRFVMPPRHELTTRGPTWCLCIIIVMKHKEKPLVRGPLKAKTGQNAETISSASANVHGNGTKSRLKSIFNI